MTYTQKLISRLGYDEYIKRHRVYWKRRDRKQKRSESRLGDLGISLANGGGLISRLRMEGYDRSMAKAIWWWMRKSEYMREPFPMKYCRCDGDYKCLVHYLDTMKEVIHGRA